MYFSYSYSLLAADRLYNFSTLAYLAEYAWVFFVFVFRILSPDAVPVGLQWVQYSGDETDIMSYSKQTKLSLMC